MSSPESNPFQQLESVCIKGHGTDQPPPTFAYPDSLDKLADALGAQSLGEHAVLLSPPESVAIDPMLQQPTLGDVYRERSGHRSFSMRVALPQDGFGEKTIGSVTIKGGDLHHARHIIPAHYGAAWLRLGMDQIPGGGLLDYLRRERDAAYQLHAHANATLGSIANVALPLQLRTLEAVEGPSGNRQTIRSYLNSREYTPFNDESKRSTRARLMNVPERTCRRIGTFLLDHKKRTPAVYTYATPGDNIRVDAMSDALYRARYTAAEGFAFQRSAKGPHHAMAAQDLPQAILYGVYSALAREYNFDVSEALPKMTEDEIQINGGSWPIALVAAPYYCKIRGITDTVLYPFIDRITQVAAVAHSMDTTLSGSEMPSRRMIAGSFHPRNVTIGGTVLDLDTFNTIDRVGPAAIRQDIRELLGTIRCLQRFVTSETRNIEESVKDCYSSYLETCGVSGKRMDSLLALMKNSYY